MIFVFGLLLLLLVGSSQHTVRSAELCTADADCHGDNNNNNNNYYYCSQGVCREFGTCASRLDCLNPSNEFWAVECVGVMDCSSSTSGGRCRVTCGGNHFCPKGDDVQCAVSPCSVTECNEPYEYCVDTYCGSCNALFINATGHEVCTTTPDDTDEEDEASSLEEASVCTQDNDCVADTEFCSLGECRAVGTCETVLDCFNPSNVHEYEIDCEGHEICNKETNQCELVCGDSCPRNDEVLRTEKEPCETIVCNETHVSCVNDYCGGRHAIFYNEEGDTVCPRSCTGNKDCIAETEYCIDGMCGAPLDLCDGYECEGNFLERRFCEAIRYIFLNILCLM